MLITSQDLEPGPKARSGAGRPGRGSQLGGREERPAEPRRHGGDLPPPHPSAGQPGLFQPSRELRCSCQLGFLPASAWVWRALQAPSLSGFWVRRALPYLVVGRRLWLRPTAARQGWAPRTWMMDLLPFLVSPIPQKPVLGWGVLCQGAASRYAPPRPQCPARLKLLAAPFALRESVAGHLSLPISKYAARKLEPGP